MLWISLMTVINGILDWGFVCLARQGGLVWVGGFLLETLGLRLDFSSSFSKACTSVCVCVCIYFDNGIMHIPYEQIPVLCMNCIALPHVQ